MPQQRSPRVEVSVLGPVAITIGSSTRLLTARKPDQILVTLLAAGRRRLPSDRLAAEVWPTSNGRAARDLVQNAVWQLNRRTRDLLGGPLVARSDTDDYHLDGVDLVVDADAVEQAAPHAHEVDEVDTLLGAWRGSSAFAGFDALPLVAAAADRLAELRLVLVERRISLRVDAGAFDEAAAELERLLDAHPHHEALARLLMTALHAGGRRAEAIAVYERAAAALDDRGLEAGPALRAARAALRDDVAEFPGHGAEPRVGIPVGTEGVPTARRPADDPWAGVLSPRPIAHPVGPLFGRLELVDDALALLDHHRIVTFSGLGGVGKTRLALEVAQRLAPAYAGRVAFVDLGDLDDPALLESHLRSSLGVRDLDDGTGSSTTGPTRIARALGDTPCLVVLDNAEHLLAAASSLVRELVAGNRSLTILVTSRRPLDVSGEFVLPVGPLDTAAGVELLRTTGVPLATPPAELARLVGVVDGNPLGLELCASLLRTLPVVDVLAELTAEPDDGPAPYRETTPLDRVLAWTWDHLPTSLQAYWRRLAVLDAPFTMATAKALVPRGEPTPAVLLVAQLTAAGLLHVVAPDPDHPGPPQYRIGFLARRFARRQLTPDERAEVEDALRHHYLDLARRHGARLTGAEQLEARLTLDAELPNLRRTLQHAVATADGSFACCLVAELSTYWFLAGFWAEGATWVRRSLAVAGDASPAERARAAVAYGRSVGTFAGTAAGLSLYRNAVDDARAAGDRRTEGWAALYLTIGLSWQRDRSSRDTFRHAASVAEELGDHHLLAGIAKLRGARAGAAGDLVTSRRHYLDARQQYLAVGDRANAANTMLNLGMLLQRHEAPDAARVALDDAKTLAAGLSMLALELHVESTLAVIDAESGNPDEVALEGLAHRFDVLGDIGCRTTCNRMLADAHVARGDPHGALALLRRDLHQVVGRDDQEFGLSLVAIAERFELIGRRDDAAALAHGAASALAGSGMGLSPRQRARVDALTARLPRRLLTDCPTNDELLAIGLG